MNDTLIAFIERAQSVLDRLDPLLPPLQTEPDWNSSAFRWQRQGAAFWLESIPNPDSPEIDRLTHINKQRDLLVQNTRQFVTQKPANHALLTGARGTGKSSLIKALLPLFGQQGLRLIQVDKMDLVDLPQITRLIGKRPERFILFCDDLSFEAGENAYKALKTALDGGLAKRQPNLLIYATSNRRHLMPEPISDNLPNLAQNGEIHPVEAVEEKIALSDRFGLWLSFYPFDQAAYLAAVRKWLQYFHLAITPEMERAALQWSLARGSRSGRVAWQFACDWAGKQ